MNKQIDTVLKKEMTRGEFMATLGFGAVTMMGFGSVLNFLRGHGSLPKTAKATAGYGSSSYGQ